MITNKGLEIGSDKALFVDLDDASAETISGGYEVFTVRNRTKYNIPYTIDGTRAPHYAARSGGGAVWTAYRGGIVSFDKDGRSGYIDQQRYNLANGGLYTFRDNKKTVGNPHDIDLYRTA